MLVGNINLFGGCRRTRAPAPLSHRVILNIGVKEFKLYAGTNERGDPALFITLIQIISTRLFEY